MQETQSSTGPDGDEAGPRVRRRVWALGLGCLLLWTYVPLTRALDVGPMYTRSPEGAWSVRNQDLRHWRGVRWNWSSESGARGSVHWSSELAADFPRPYPTRRIWVVCQTPGVAAQALGEALVEQLLAEDEMVEVALFPFVQLPITEFRPPDLWITLDQLECDSTTLPGYFSVQTSVALSITPRLFEALDKTQQDIPAPYFASLLNLQSTRMGLISAAGRWKAVGESLADLAQVRGSLEILEDQQVAVAAVLPAGLLHGPVRCDPIQSLAQFGTDLKQLKEGPAWMIHDLSVWSLKPGDDRRGRIQRLRASLLEEGWKAVSGSATGFRMKLGTREITVGAQVDPALFPASDWSREEFFQHSPIGIRHEQPFTPEQSLRYLSERIEQGLTPAQLHALLAQLPPKRRQALIASQLDSPTAPPLKLSELPHIATILESLLDPTR